MSINDKLDIVDGPDGYDHLEDQREYANPYVLSASVQRQTALAPVPESAIRDADEVRGDVNAYGAAYWRAAQKVRNVPCNEWASISALPATGAGVQLLLDVDIQRVRVVINGVGCPAGLYVSTERVQPGMLPMGAIYVSGREWTMLHTGEIWLVTDSTWIPTAVPLSVLVERYVG